MEQPDPRVERVPLDDLALHPRNVREGDIGAIMESLRAHGQYRPIVVQRQTPEGEPRMVILAGNHTAMAAKELGWPDILAALVDVTDEQGIEIMLADNRTHDLGRDREEDLAALLASLDGHSLERTAWTRDDLDDMLADLDRAEAHRRQGQTDPDAVGEPPETPWVQPGDLFALGKHRLLVGDATSREDVTRLLAGARPRLMVTDPPYGVNYDPEWRNKYMVAARPGWSPSDRTDVVTNDDRADWTPAWALSPADVAYVWHGALHASVVEAGLASVGFEVRAQIIWQKERPVFGRGAYHWAHEPCWYLVRHGKTAEWIAGRDQSTVWEITHLVGTIKATPEDPTDLVHATQKPCEVMQRPIRNHKGDVFDPFLGSGTTLIAAEREGRACYALELEPRYAQMAIERWQAYTGETATKVEE